MHQLIKSFRYVSKFDWSLLITVFLIVLFLLSFTSCTTLSKATDYIDKLSTKLDEYGPSIKDTAGKIGNVAKTISDVSTSVQNTYDKIVTEVDRVKTQVSNLNAQIDTDKDGSISLAELLKYLAGAIGIGGSALYVSASKSRKETDELWDKVMELQKRDFPVSKG